MINELERKVDVRNHRNLQKMVLNNETIQTLMIE